LAVTKTQNGAHKILSLILVGLRCARGGDCMRGQSQAWRGSETGDMEGEDGDAAVMRVEGGSGSRPPAQVQASGLRWFAMRPRLGPCEGCISSMTRQGNGWHERRRRRNLEPCHPAHLQHQRVSSVYGELRRWELFSPSCTMRVTCRGRVRQQWGCPGRSPARVRFTTCCVDVTNVGDKWPFVEVLARLLY
jgi:hypothetical protein